jgi:hypothetical protein
MTSARSARAIPIVLRSSELLPAVENGSRRNRKKPTKARFASYLPAKDSYRALWLQLDLLSKDSSTNDIEHRRDCRNRQYRIPDFHLPSALSSAIEIIPGLFSAPSAFPGKNESSNDWEKAYNPSPVIVQDCLA